MGAGHRCKASYLKMWSILNETSDPSPEKNISCFARNTVLRGLPFGGVPVVLVLDFLVFLVLLVIFCMIRKKFWDYGRIALVADQEGSSEAKHSRHGQMPSPRHSNDDIKFEKGFCSWLPYVIRMTDEKIKAKCGMDAVHYLSFQRHLIFLLFIMAVASLTVILPLNLSGDLLGDEARDFGRTTIGNLPIGYNLLWLHTVFAVLYLVLAVILLRRHTSRMKIISKDMANTRKTLLVCSVPETATEESVRLHFLEAYPACQVTDVTLGFDVAQLMHLDSERIKAGKNLHYYECVLDHTGRREMINACLGGHLICCANSEKVDAITYYRTKEQDLLMEFTKQVELVPQRPLGIAFVTLLNEDMAKLILKDFNAFKFGGIRSCCRKEPQLSSRSIALTVNRENMSVPGCFWFIRYVIINLLLSFLLTFLTTPTIILNTMDMLDVTKPIEHLNSPIISQFFPTLLLMTFSSLLPTIVYYSTLVEKHWSRSSQQRNMMRKLYFFLLFMVLILPSLGLTRPSAAFSSSWIHGEPCQTIFSPLLSLSVFFRWLFDHTFILMRFECVFLPDRGAFFVNYVIAAALVGSAMELLRLPGLLLYTVRLTCARSAAERKNIKQNQAYEFQYGAQYAGTLCVYTVIVSYSIACPIIMPFGLMYMLLRHVVDKHNMYFAYLPARLDRKVHVGAVNLALAAPIMCLIWLYFFSVLRAGLRASTSLFTLVVLCITVFICLSYTFGILKVFSPHNYAEKEEDEDAAELVEEDTEVYLPRVLYHKSLASTTQAVQFEEFHEESGGSLTRSFSPEEEPSELSESETTESESTL
ncbi:CSC1-like protein 1 isoform X3 [Scophthalmus maximus]|uniref:CSC1-like protein 1 isoform X3 n=1 Tax=Scophthalmus maximus TaxID=52904 RepID=UPI001FA8F962|nr:CSC1-like protein 1 isoform X3 [Scophthalmus maximus]